MLLWDWYGFHKKHAGTRYAELVFLQPVGSVGHLLHSGGMKRRHTFFMILWDQYGFEKKRAMTRYIDLVFLHPVGSGGHIMHSGAFGT
jgi:hypothetical protein